MALPRLRMNTGDERLIHPNQLIYIKMEDIVHLMLDEQDGVPIKTVKSFLSKIPSVFMGADMIAWITKNITVCDQAEAVHLAHLLASHGYVFPIDDHVLTVKNDGTFYRFQTPYFWPSNCWEPENTDYAVYLCKRTMQNKAHLELEDFEAENLAKLQKMFSRKWEFVFMQAEAQYKVDKKRDRLERQILDSQERAFWDVHRPVPGCVNTTEVDFRKLSRSGRPKFSGNTYTETEPGTSGLVVSIPGSSHHSLKPGLRRCTHVQDSLRHEIVVLERRLAKNVLKTSKVVESFLSYFSQRNHFDPFLNPTEPNNPWISDTPDLWVGDKITGEISPRRVKLWELAFDELLSDSAGREILQKFLDKEYSGENLRFWWEVQKLRKCSSRMVPVLVTEIYNEYLSANASSPVNVDSKVMDITDENLKNPNRWSFDEAADHIYCLMKNDSYQRFLRSDFYRDLYGGSKKKRSLKQLQTSGKESIFPFKISAFGQGVTSHKQQ